MLKRSWRRLGKLALVEVICFLIVILSTYYLHSQFHEGEPGRYDPDVLYLTGTGERRTVYNHTSGSQGRVRQIWMFGGSTMRGVTDFDEHTIPSLVARIMNQEEPLMPAVISNFGSDGFNSLLETKYLQKLLIERPVPPDVIIFYDGANDYTYFAQYRTPDAHQGYRQGKALIESYHRSFFGLPSP